MLQKEGITVTGIYYCPHHTEGVVEQYGWHVIAESPSQR